MKYAFVTLLVILALVLVFHIEKFLPIPRALDAVMSSTLGPHLPFKMKAVYAESCIAGLQGKQGQVQYAVSESAVRVRELDRQIESWHQHLAKSVERLRFLVNQRPAVSSDTIEDDAGDAGGAV